MSKQQIFLDPEWHLTLEAFKHNPSVIRFTAEQMITSKIASAGIASENLVILPAPIMVFEGGVWCCHLILVGMVLEWC